MNKHIGLLLLTLIGTQVSAQLVPGAKGNLYRSSNNPLYWKNKKPYEGYWQQDVYYQIKAKLDDATEIITGEEELVYYNNSPHTLTEAYFHLYQNAVQPGSLVDELYNTNKTKHEFGRYEKEKKGTTISVFAVNGKSVDFTVDYTVLKCKLPIELKPGDSCVFTIGFKTHFDRGTIRRRMKVYDHHGYKHFNGVHWYPRICVYDRKFTWETAQHMEHEFYGDFGSYDVQLELPNHYVNEATGVLQNPSEIFPGDLRQKLDISNFADKKIGSQPSVIVAPDGTYKAWRYHADNVHDFAWTADPTYRIGEVKWNGVSCIALAQENNAAGWQKSAKFVADVVSVYSRDFGMYEYPKMVAADAADGMEYPMLTLDGGYYPSHQGLLAHEIGHNWFFGMVGNNETYRASLDEGFTQFLTSWSMKQLSSKTGLSVDYGTVYAGYLFDALDGEDAILNTHSDDFENAIGHGGGYKHVYYKTATMLYNLQYVLGDSVFQKAMKNYVRQWKICHPYVEDFRQTIIQSAGTDLNWFFDQWFETTKAADYGVKAKRLNGDKYKITVKRKGDMVMPVYLLFVPKDDGGVFSRNIPVSQYQRPPVKNNLSPWIGWGKLRPEYSFEVTVPNGLKRVYLDPSERLADINRMDNVWPRTPQLSFDKDNVRDNSFLGGYKMLLRPDLWYNSEDGIKTGIKWSGQYAMRRHITDVAAWYGTGIGTYLGNQPADRFSYLANYSHEIRRKGQINLHSRYLAGLWLHKAGWMKEEGNNEWSVNLQYMRRQRFAYLNPYADFPMMASLSPEQNLWSTGRNISLNVGYKHSYRYFTGKGSISTHFRTSTPWSDAQYGLVSVNWLNQQNLGDKLEFRTRVFGALGQGNNFPAESAIYVSGANPEELQFNKFTRDLGAIPLSDLNASASTIGQALGMGGGLNIRGMQGYLAPYNAGDTVLSFIRGNRGMAVNGELDFSRLLSFIPRISMFSGNIYLFADAGVMGIQTAKRTDYSGILADAGLGMVVSIKNWNRLSPGKKQWFTGSAPLNIRLDLPFFVNAVPESQKHIQFRWVLAINRAF